MKFLTALLYRTVLAAAGPYICWDVVRGIIERVQREIRRAMLCRHKPLGCSDWLATSSRITGRRRQRWLIVMPTGSTAQQNHANIGRVGGRAGQRWLHIAR